MHPSVSMTQVSRYSPTSNVTPCIAFAWCGTMCDVLTVILSVHRPYKGDNHTGALAFFRELLGGQNGIYVKVIS